MEENDNTVHDNERLADNMTNQITSQTMGYPPQLQDPEEMKPSFLPSPATFNPSISGPIGNHPFPGPIGIVPGLPPGYQAPPTMSMQEPPPTDGMANPMNQPPFFMPPPFGMRPGGPPLGLPQHFNHPPPNMLPRPRTALPPPSAFYQDPSMFNFFPPSGLPSLHEKNNNVDIWVETSTPEGKVYYYHSKTRESTWAKPSVNDNTKVVTQVEFEMMSNNNNNNNNRTPVSQSDITSTAGTNTAVPLSSAQKDVPDVDLEKAGSPVKDVPTTSDAEVVTSEAVDVATSQANQTTGQMAMPQPNRPILDENLEKMATEWTEHRNEYGRIFYYNTKTMESTWEMPAILMEYKEKQRLFPSNGFPLAQTNQMSAEDEERLKQEAKAAEEERKRKKQQEASKPIFTRPVPATPWCMVWTKDGRIFFHNPSSGTSSWDCPPDLAGRPDVQKWMAEEPPAGDNNKKVDPKRSESPAAKRQKMESEVPAFSAAPVMTSASHFPSLHNPHQMGGYPPNFLVNHHQQQHQLQQQQFHQQQQQLHHQQQQHQQNFGLVDANKDAMRQTTQVVDPNSVDKTSAEEKLQKFMELLAEKEVSAFSTWDKELPKLVFDPRYTMLPAKERRPAFEQYLRTRCDEERKEKLHKMKVKKDEFKSLLHGSNITGRWTFLDFCSKFSRDERFKAIEKMKERESLFNEFITDLRKREKMDTKSALEQAKKDFVQMLKEKVPHGLLVAGGHWQDARVYVQSDPRYKAVSNHHHHQAEDWYKELCKASPNDDGSDEGELVDEIDEQVKKARERQERVEASLREREKAVQESLYASLMERDKERKSHMREESVQHFKALMADMVKTADVSWRDTRHSLRKDARWGLAKHLEREEKEQLFEEHVSNLSKKNKMAYHRLLDETLAGSLTTTWKEIRKKIRDDPRCSKFSSHEKKREKEFDDYMVQRRTKAKQEFKDLLRETRLINHRAAELASETGQHQMKDIIVILQKDKRYLVLDSMPEERMDILIGYVNEISKRAPSPPPTASDPRSRNPIR